MGTAPIRALSGHGAPAHTGPTDYVPYKKVFPSQDLSYYHYMGSLTTPPCTTNVTWIILSHVVELSHDQLTKFRAHLSDKPASENQMRFDPALSFYGVSPRWNLVFGTNNRPVTTLGGRKVYFFKDGLAEWFIPLLISLAVLS